MVGTWGIPPALGLALPLALLSACDGSLENGDTPYDGCLPPCIEAPLSACIGAATSCEQIRS